MNIPRAIKKFSSRYGSPPAIAYLDPKTRGPFTLGWDTEVMSTTVTETHVISRRDYQASHMSHVFVELEEFRVAALFGSQVVHAAKMAVHSGIAEGLIREKHVVEPEVEPELKFAISFTVQGRVPAWPDVPGVTTGPYAPVEGSDVRFPLGLKQGDIYEKVFMPLMDVYDAARRNSFSVVVLCERMTLDVAKRRTIGEYVRLVEDERVPRGILRVAEEIL